MPHDEHLHIHVLGPDDADLLGAAVLAFRGVAVADHSPFLTDPATLALAATVRAPGN
jgi:hypothetical protein